jgi:hypothetical protein
MSGGDDLRRARPVHDCRSSAAVARRVDHCPRGRARRADAVSPALCLHALAEAAESQETALSDVFGCYRHYRPTIAPEQETLAGIDCCSLRQRPSNGYLARSSVVGGRDPDPHRRPSEPPSSQGRWLQGQHQHCLALDPGRPARGPPAALPRRHPVGHDHRGAAALAGGAVRGGRGLGRLGTWRAPAGWHLRGRLTDEVTMQRTKLHRGATARQSSRTNLRAWGRQ